MYGLSEPLLTVHRFTLITAPEWAAVGLTLVFVELVGTRAV